MQVFGDHMSEITVPVISKAGLQRLISACNKPEEGREDDCYVLVDVREPHEVAQTGAIETSVIIPRTSVREGRGL